MKQFRGTLNKPPDGQTIVKLSLDECVAENDCSVKSVSARLPGVGVPGKTAMVDQICVAGQRQLMVQENPRSRTKGKDQ